MVSGSVALFVGFSKWFNNGRESTALEATVCVIRVIIGEMDECVGEK